MAKKTKKSTNKYLLGDFKRTLERLNKYYIHNGYVYNPNPRRAGGRTINCCGFAFRALYHFGIISKSAIYAYTKHGRLKGRGASEIKRKCIYKIIDMPIGDAIAKGLVKPGDIVGYKNGAHTEVYKGKCMHNGKLMLKFYNYGPGFKGRNGVSYRPLDYDRPVGCIIRIPGMIYTNKRSHPSESEVRAKVVAKAKSFLGTKQGDKKHHLIIDTFNRLKPDGWAMTYVAPWCATFVSAIMMMVFGIVKAERYFPLSANCNALIEKAKKKGIWKESDAYKPKPGDLILYDWDDSGRGDCKGSPDHVGIVERVSTTKVSVIEGNVGAGVVGRRKVNVNGLYIRGYITPKYASLADTI